MTATTPQIVSIDGSGAGRCGRCRGTLDFSWLVRYADGEIVRFCSIHVPAMPS